MTPTYITMTDHTKRTKVLKRRIGGATGYRLVATFEPGTDAEAVVRLLNAQEYTGRRLLRP